MVWTASTPSSRDVAGKAVALIGSIFGTHLSGQNAASIHLERPANADRAAAALAGIVAECGAGGAVTIRAQGSAITISARNEDRLLSFMSDAPNAIRKNAATINAIYSDDYSILEQACRHISHGNGQSMWQR